MHNMQQLSKGVEYASLPPIDSEMSVSALNELLAHYAGDNSLPEPTGKDAGNTGLLTKKLPKV